MLNSQLETKFIDQVEIVIGSGRAACWDIAALPDVAVIALMACGGSRRCASRFAPGRVIPW